MSEWVKTLVTSSVIATAIGGGVSLLVSWYKIEQELHSRQIEAGYEDLVKGNALAWQADALDKKLKQKHDKELKAEAKRIRRESEVLITVARQKIAAFGDERVVKAMSNYFSKYGGENNGPLPSCCPPDKFRADTLIYKNIRDTLGVKGSVSPEDLAPLMFLCNLK